MQYQYTSFNHPDIYFKAQNRETAYLGCIDVDGVDVDSKVD